MKALLEKALPILGKGWDAVVAFAKSAWAWLAKAGNTIYDPPPKTIRFWFWSWAALMLVAWLTFAFTNSWFYKPTAEFFATLGDDGDVFIPDHIEPLPPVATPAVTVPSVEVVCKDMSDTPQCEPVYESAEKYSVGTQTQAEVNQPVAKPKKATRNKLKRVRKHQPYVTYWGY